LSTNEQIVREFFEARRTRDSERVSALLDSNIKYHMPGASRFAGDYVGREAVMAMWKAQREVHNTSPVRLYDICTSDVHAVALTRAEGTTKAGVPVEWSAATVYSFKDGKVSELFPIISDQKAFDDFWS
jgi:uncharacterized protein